MSTTWNPFAASSPLLFTAIAALSAGACADLVDFDVDHAIVEQQIAGSPIPGPLQFLFPTPLEIDIQSKIEEQDPGPIDSVTLRALRLDITATEEPDGDTDDWSFVSRVDLFVESTADGSQLPRVKVASAVDPGATRSLVFTPEPGVNLRPYLDEGCLLFAEAEGTAPPDAVSFDGHSTFTVRPL